MTFDFTPRHLGRIEHLRFKRLWLGVGVGLIVAIVIGSISDLPEPVIDVMLQDKLMHLVAYAGLMGWFAQIFRHDLMRLLFALAFVALGVAIEYLQGMTETRQFEVLDMIANSSGVLLAWALAYTSLGNFLPWVEERFLAGWVGA